MSDFQDIQNKVYQIAVNHGFHEGDPEPDKFFNDIDRVARLLMLVVTELAEAMEAVRHNDIENFKEELADTAIRIMDMCEAMGIDLVAAIQAKSKVNAERKYKHGKRC